VTGNLPRAEPPARGPKGLEGGIRETVSRGGSQENTQAGERGTRKSKKRDR